MPEQWPAQERVSQIRLKASDALSLVAGGAALIDLRTPQWQARGGLIEGARVVGKIDALDALRAERDCALILFCANDEASGSVVRLLRKAGFTQVADVEGGFAALAAAGAKVTPV